jgi:hypothetical protein
MGPVIVHELVHALQDQHFDLETDRFGDGGTDARLAFAAIVEGDASDVELRYRASRSPQELAMIQADERRLFPAAKVDAYRRTPKVLLDQVHFLYEVGRRYLDLVRNTGGPAAVDRLFTSPPTSTAQIIRRNVEGTVEVVHVDPPTDTGPIIAEGSLGHLGLLAVLDGSRYADAAAGGWRGDRYAITKHGTRSCIDDVLAVDASPGSTALKEELAAWAATHGGTLAPAGPDRIVLHACSAG